MPLNSIFIIAPIILLYFIFGMLYDKIDGYALKGWLFAPARGLRKLICGMFFGHEYEDGFCTHCLKKERKP